MRHRTVLDGVHDDEPEFVLRAATMPEAPDIYVNSLVDDLDEVAAFEGLVACHGGLGGWQDRGMVVHPVDFEMPEELTSQLAANAKLKAAFAALTPGRQRGYIFHFSQPKQSKTRAARVKKNIPRILEGIGLND